MNTNFEYELLIEYIKLERNFLSSSMIEYYNYRNYNYTILFPVIMSMSNKLLGNIIILSDIYI